MKNKYILKNRRRFFSIIFTLILILFTTLFATNAYGYKEPAYKQITVKSGDSLWTIALKYNNNDDVRKYIYKIKKVNHLNSSAIYVGTQLRIPA
jgi:LysM repeat protein